jgi:hypothetical protein
MASPAVSVSLWHAAGEAIIPMAIPAIIILDCLNQ